MTRFRHVNTKRIYVFDPVPMDRFDAPYGVREGILKTGDKVRVVALPGCPRPNTMGHAHIKTLDGKFAGLVCTNSLTPAKRMPNMCK
jgi:hypothetical protein